jgi:CubicO group peptidase (beta-lactamase class C family)
VARRDVAGREPGRLVGQGGARTVDGACAALADQPPWFPPGDPAEHVYSYGHLVSGIVRAVTGRHVDRVWTDEIAGPLGIDLTFGPHPDAEPMVDPGGAFAAEMLGRSAAGDPRLWQPAELCEAGVVNSWTAEEPDPVWAPAVVGWGGADAIASLYAFWSGGMGHLPGKPSVWERSRRPHVTGTDRVLGRSVAWAFGVQVEGPMWGMGGIGGCAGWHDDRTGLSIGIAGPVLGMGSVLDPLEAAIDGLAA